LRITRKVGGIENGLIFEEIGKLRETKSFVGDGNFVVENGVGAEGGIESVDGLNKTFTGQTTMVFLREKSLAKIGSSGLVAKIETGKSFFKDVGGRKGVFERVASVFIEGLEERAGLGILFFFELGDIIGIKNGFTTGAGNSDLIGVKRILNKNYLSMGSGLINGRDIVVNIIEIFGIGGVGAVGIEKVTG
jgi:hypothetical protein